MRLECPATIVIDMEDGGRETPAGQRELIKMVAEKLVEKKFIFHLGKLPGIGVSVSLDNSN